MENRKEQIKQIENFIEESQIEVDNIFKKLGWNEENTLKKFHNDNKSLCPINSDKDDPLYPESYPWQYAVTIDGSSLNEILKNANNKTSTLRNVPNKFSDFQVNFSKEEKLLLYEYVLKKTGKLSEPEVSVTFEHSEGGNKKEMTFAEIVAFKRNLKRRRLKHRTTKVPPLSHTEELRNLIELQMQAFHQYIGSGKSDKYEMSRDDNKSDKVKPSSSKLYEHRDSHSRRKDRSSSRGRRKSGKEKKKKKHRSRSENRKSKRDSSHTRKKSKKRHRHSRSRD